MRTTISSSDASRDILREGRPRGADANESRKRRAVLSVPLSKLVEPRLPESV